MFTIETTQTISGNVVSRFYFNRFSEAYNSFIERCNERSYEHEVDGDVFTAGGRGHDYTITLIVNN
jgi:hypothetical protein